MKISKTRFVIGTDISKQHLDHAVLCDGELLFHRHTANTPEAVKGLVEELKALEGFTMTRSLFCTEQTGVYGHIMARSLKRMRARVVVGNAQHIKQSLGLIRGKNDKVDALRIARYAWRNSDELTLWEPRRIEVEQLALLLSTRSKLSALGLSLKHPFAEHKEFMPKGLGQLARQCCAKSLAALDADFTSVESATETLIKSDERLSYLFSLVSSIQFIGPITAAHLLVATNEFKYINDPKKFACYAGVAPFMRESGTYKGKARVSPVANRKMKALLHICAFRAVTKQGELRDYFLRKQLDGKPKMAVLNAIRYKLICRVFACVNQNRPFEKVYTRSPVPGGTVEGPK